MSYVEVDQSGKVEQFTMDTVVAMSNGTAFSVLLPSKLKQKLFIKYKGVIRGLKYKLFCIALYYCLYPFIDSETKIIICPEYWGQDLLLKSELVCLFVKNKTSFSHELISFEIITKKSPAHRLAILTHRGEIEPDRILNESDFEKLLK